MIFDHEKRQEFIRHIDELIAARPAPDDEYVIASGACWAYGDGARFEIRPLGDPLKGVAILPSLKLAYRIQSFAGGQVLTVTGYLVKVRRLLK